MAKKIEKLDALIFIDTNIFLDFYRIRRTDVSMKYLEEIVKHKDIIVTSSQVEMEFKKNRQSAILESITEVTKKGNINLSVPAILSDSQALKMMKKAKQDIDDQQRKLKLQIERILKNPNQNDQVFKCLQKVFSNKSIINLDRENKLRFTIRNLAKKRFLLGYPPRKKDDNSIGDAVNWEWIIKCAELTGKHIIIVIRDTDFGTISESESYLNDWLRQEFKQRISQKRKLILTDKLSKAFQLVKIPVTKEMIEEEKIVINDNFILTQQRLQETIRRFSETIKDSNIFETMNNINKFKLPEN